MDGTAGAFAGSGANAEVLGQSPKNFLRTARQVSHDSDLDRLSDDDLEQQYLGMIPRGPKLTSMEEHLLWCYQCIERAHETENYVDVVRAAIVEGNFDLE